MFWWIVLAIMVTFGAAIFLKVSRVSIILGGLIAIPLARLFFRQLSYLLSENGDDETDLNGTVLDQSALQSVLRPPGKS